MSEEHDLKMADNLSDLEGVEVALEVFARLLETDKVEVRPEASLYRQVLHQIALLKSELNLSRSFSAKAYIALRDIVGNGDRDWPREIKHLPDEVMYLNGLLDEYEASFQSKSGEAS